MNRADLNVMAKQVIRQDRIECDPDRHTIQVHGKIVGKVLNFSPFGFAIESALSLEQQYDELLFCVDGYEISNLSATRVREHASNEKFLSGYSVIGAPLDVEAALAIKQLNDALESYDAKIIREDQIDPSFRMLTWAFKDVLLDLERIINELEIDSFQNNLSTVQHFEDRVASRVANFLSDKLSPEYEKFTRIISQIDSSRLNAHFEYFRNSVGQILYKSAYAHRAFFKPKGYAGDYEMMNNVYHRELRGESLFAKCLQRYFVDEPAGKAVRNREVYMRHKIMDALERAEGRPLKILSVASGPAFEIQNLVKTPNLDLSNLDLYLLDQDLDALKFAQRKIHEAGRASNNSCRLNLLNLNIKQVIQSGLPEKDFDLIYSAGLFDYFTDPVALYAASQLMRSVKQNGQVIIGNFSKDNPNQMAMNLIMDWDLICRSAEELTHLYGQVSNCKIESEEQGINLFAVLNSKIK